jgi:hypothetical protein
VHPENRSSLKIYHKCYQTGHLFLPTQNDNNYDWKQNLAEDYKTTSLIKMSKLSKILSFGVDLSNILTNICNK